MPSSLRQRLDALREREAVLLTGIVLLALACRIAVAVITRSWIFSEADHFFDFGYEMGEVGAALAGGDGFAWPAWGKFPERPTAWMAPAYPWLVGHAFRAFGIYSVPAAVVLLTLQVLVSAVSCVLLYLIGRRVYNGRVGLLAALMLALYPSAIHFDVQKIWSTPLYVLCLLVVVYALLRMVDRPTLKSGAVLGAAIGITMLVDSVVVAAIPFILAWLYFGSASDRGRTLGGMAVTVVVAGLIVTPWLVRNYQVFGKATYIKSNFGNELFMGNNPLATGGADDYRVTGRRITEILSETELKFLEAANEVEYNRFLRTKAVDWIRDNPGRFVQLTATRVARFWTTIKPPGGSLEMVAFGAYLAVLFLAVIGLLKSGFDRDVVLILILLLSLPVPYYFTLAAHVRYRFPIVPFLMLFAANGLLVGWRALQARRAGGFV
ncbi:MAG: glycosyltransferase family 39 protein [Gemmatimonadota bacterium]